MVDIGVYTRKEVLDHKMQDGCKEDDLFCYWSLPRFGQIDVQEGDKLWVASQGQWQGYFEIFQTSDEDEDPCGEYWESGEVRFWSESWHPFLGVVTRKPFQGFTYKVPDLKVKGGDKNA